MTVENISPQWSTLTVENRLRIMAARGKTTCNLRWSQFRALHTLSELLSSKWDCHNISALGNPMRAHIMRASRILLIVDHGGGMFGPTLKKQQLEISFYSSKTFLTLHWVSLRVAAKRDTFCLELSERSLLVIPSWSREVNGLPSQSRCAPKVGKYARKPPLPRLCKQYWRGFGFCLLYKRQMGICKLVLILTSLDDNMKMNEWWVVLCHHLKQLERPVCSEIIVPIEILYVCPVFCRWWQIRSSDIYSFCLCQLLASLADWWWCRKDNLSSKYLFVRTLPNQTCIERNYSFCDHICVFFSHRFEMKITERSSNFS